MSDIDKIRIPSTSTDYQVKSARMMGYIKISATGGNNTYTLSNNKFYNMLDFASFVTTAGDGNVVLPSMVNGDIICVQFPMYMEKTGSTSFYIKFTIDEETCFSNLPEKFEIKPTKALIADSPEKLYKVYVLKSNDKYILVR